MKNLIIILILSFFNQSFSSIDRNCCCTENFSHIENIKLDSKYQLQITVDSECQVLYFRAKVKATLIDNKGNRAKTDRFNLRITLLKENSPIDFVQDKNRNHRSITKEIKRGGTALPICPDEIEIYVTSYKDGTRYECAKTFSPSKMDQVKKCE